MSLFEVKGLEFWSFPASSLRFFFFIYILLKYLLAPLCKLKLLMVQGFESILISVRDFQRCTGDRGYTRLAI